jgi:phenylpyruvate tautomerase PptA (4-oxalocrotonate tautomerase family)
MAQVKIYGNKAILLPIRKKLSDTLHSCIVTAFKYPESKKFHRFFYLEEGDFYFPEDKSDQYTIIEISLFEGRSVEAKKALYQLIFTHFEQDLLISPNDVEIILTETPLYNWGIRGMPGDELALDYKVVV